MEKVYLITFDDVYDFERYWHEPRAFRNREDALNVFNEIKEQAKSELDEDWIREESETGFETYPDGCFAESHYGVSMLEINLE